MNLEHIKYTYIITECIELVKRLLQAEVKLKPFSDMAFLSMFSCIHEIQATHGTADFCYTVISFYNSNFGNKILGSACPHVCKLTPYTCLQDIMSKYVIPFTTKAIIILSFPA